MTSKRMAEELGAAGYTIAPDTIRKAWSAGAPRHSLTAFLRWREARARKPGNPELQESRKHKIDLEIKILEQRLITETRENRRRSGELVERAVVRADVLKAASIARAVLIQKFETELPPKQDGLPAERIAEINRAAIHEVCVILSSPEAWPSEGAGKTTTDSASPTTDTAITPGHANPAPTC